MQKVSIDFSILGQGLYHPQARTGVYRVVNELANELFKRQHFDIRLAAPNYLAETLVHLGNKYNLQSVHGSNDDFWAITEKTLLKNFDSQSVAAKSIRALFHKITKYEQISTKKLNEISLYHSPYDPIPTVVQAQKKLKKIITIYDLIAITNPEWFSFNGTHVIQRMLDSLRPDNVAVCISEASRTAFLEKSCIPESQTFVVPLAANPSVFYECKDNDLINSTKFKYGIPKDASYFLSIATLEPRKNIPHTIRAFFELIRQQNTLDLYLVLVGTKGWQFDAIFEELHLNQSLRSRVIVTGYAPDQDLAPLYSGALGFVYMSLAEGFGLPPLEAMQCAVPVIASNVSSLPEVVADAGIALSPTDQNGLSEAMLRLYQNSDLIDLLKNKSIEQAKKFNWDLFIDSYERIYKSLD